MVAFYQRRDNGRDGEAIFLGPFSTVAAACPAILMVLHPNAAKFIGEAPPPVTVTWHAVPPVQVSSKFVFGWVERQGWLREWIVCWSWGDPIHLFLF